MIRKTIFIAVVVLLMFFIYRGISPSGADKIINKISSIRQNTTNQTGNTNTGGNLISGTLLSGTENSYERLTQSGTLKNLSGTSETANITGATNTGNQKTVVKPGNTNTGTTTKPPVKTTSTTKTTTQTSTNTNGLSPQDMKDLNELLNNVVE